jgi:hypothetical protein
MKRIILGMISFDCGCYFSALVVTQKPGDFMFGWSIAMIVVNTIGILFNPATKDD